MDTSRFIWIIEKDENRVDGLRQALQENGILNPIKTASTTQEILFHSEYLNTEDIGLIILDLDEFGEDDVSILKHIQTDPNLKSIPFLKFASTIPREDLSKILHMTREGFFLKPLTFAPWVNLIGLIFKIWFLPNSLTCSKNDTPPSISC